MVKPGGFYPGGKGGFALFYKRFLKVGVGLPGAGVAGGNDAALTGIHAEKVDYANLEGNQVACAAE